MVKSNITRNQGSLTLFYRTVSSSFVLFLQMIKQGQVENFPTDESLSVWTQGCALRRWISRVAVTEGLNATQTGRSEWLLLGAAEGWIKANPLSSSSTNWCCGISPQGQELGHVEAADATVKGV